MFTSTLIRFLDRLVIAEKSFALIAEKETIRFFSAYDAKARYPDFPVSAPEEGVVLELTLESSSALGTSRAILIPAEIEIGGVEALEALAYDQALICSCSLAHADSAPFDEESMLDEEREATLRTARIWRDTMAQMKPDEADDARVLLRYSSEKPADLSPVTLSARLLEAGAPRVLLLETPETGTIVAALDEAGDPLDAEAVFADYSDTADAFGARVKVKAEGFLLDARLSAGYVISGRTVRVFALELLTKNPRAGTLSAQTLLSFLR